LNTTVERERTTAGRATIRDVAQLAGVSISTVSRVINESGYFSEQTAAKVHSAIEKLRFRPDVNARGLASQRTSTLGFLIHELAAPYVIPMLRGIEQATRESGYNLLINTQSEVDEAPILLGEHNTDGLLIVANPGISSEDLMHFYQEKFPVVLMHRIPPEGIPLPYVVAENVRSSYELITHLIEDHDLRRIAFLRGPATEQDSERREQGYREAMEEHGLDVDPELIGYGGFDEEVARETVTQWLDQGMNIDAIFSDDEAAVGVYRAIESANLRIPDDIAVVGFDDDGYTASRLSPPLTTVHVPLEELGRQAVESLVQQIQTGQADPVTMPTWIVLRRSCGCEV
jgi:LacI family transcriptional regulator